MSRLDALAARLDELLPLIAAHADWTEAERRPHDEVMRAWREPGLLLAPRSYGGGELTLLEFLTLVETASAVDGSAGWTLMTTNEELEIASAYLPGSTITELLARRDDPSWPAQPLRAEPVGPKEAGCSTGAGAS